MDYRIATVDDLTVLADMRWDFCMETGKHAPVIDKPQFFAECLKYLCDGLESGQWVYWVAMDGVTLAAHICIQRISKMPKPHKPFAQYGYITNVYTRPAYRGQGIGAKLMQYVVAWAKAEQMDTLILWPAEKAIPFYERIGFTAENNIMEYDLRVAR
jgi:GNAT superfamily N-acetyltransferase